MKMDMDDDDLIVIIVDDKGQPQKADPIQLDVKIKTEPVEFDQFDHNLDFEELMQHVQSLGDEVEIKDVGSFIKQELQEDDMLLTNEDEDLIPDEDEDFIPDEDEDFIPDEDEDFIPDEDEYIPDIKSDHDVNTQYYTNSSNLRVPKGKRRTEIVSFVEELKQRYPDYAEDEELLVTHVATVMRSTKPPPPPRDFYRVNGLRFECIQCNAIEETLSGLVRHHQDKHGPRYLVCLACGADFRSKTNLYKHEKRCNGKDRPIILKARAIAVGNKGSNRPFLKPKSNKDKKKYKKPAEHKFACTECSAMFSSKNALMAHIHLHRGERPFACDKCDNKYTSNSALKRHLHSHKEGAQFICDYCNACFKTKSSISEHIHTHAPRRFVCTAPGCGRRYAVKRALLVHMDETHRGLPLPHVCQICNKRFRITARLKIHMKNKHNMRLMTRMMYLRSLPKLSDIQVKQAKIFSKEETSAAAIFPPEAIANMKTSPKKYTKEKEGPELEEYVNALLEDFQ